MLEQILCFDFRQNGEGEHYLPERRIVRCKPRHTAGQKYKLMQNFFRTILPMAVGSLMMTSCLSSVRPDDRQGIVRFRPVLGTEVRSGNIGEASFPEDIAIGVWALTDGQEVYMNGEKAESDGEDWTTASPFLWPEKELRFIAFAPFEAGAEVKDGRIVLEDYDLSAGSAGFFVTEMTPSHSRTDSAIHLPFRLATSKVDFRVANGLNEATSVRVERITLKGVYLHGSFDSGADPEWSLSGEPADVVAYDSARDGEGPAATRDPQLFGLTLEIIPQQSKPVVEVVYAFQTADSEWLSGQANTTGELKAEWEPGRHYTYTLTLTETIVKHSPGISTSGM